MASIRKQKKKSCAKLHHLIKNVYGRVMTILKITEPGSEHLTVQLHVIKPFVLTKSIQQIDPVG